MFIIISGLAGDSTPSLITILW